MLAQVETAAQIMTGLAVVLAVADLAAVAAAGVEEAAVLAAAEPPGIGDR